jgi:predicted O-methyltransferase YrrM
MTVSFEQAWAAVDGIDGWMTEGQGRALFDTAAACPASGTIVEIGSYHGRSTVVLALAAPTGAELVAIDPHAGNDRGPQQLEGYADEAEDDHGRFRTNLERAGVADRVRHLRQFSDAALVDAPDQIDVLYIDGAHRYGPARADIRDWGALVGDGGTMLIHDSFSSIGVTLAIVRELVWSRRFRYVGRSRSLAIYRADPNAARLANALRQLGQLPWFVRNVALKLLITIRVLRNTEWPY